MSKGSRSGSDAKFAKRVGFGVSASCSRRQSVVDGKSIALQTGDDPDNRKEVFVRGVEVPLENSTRRRFGVCEGGWPTVKAKCKPDSGGQMVMEFQRGADIMVPPNSRGRAHSVKPISKKVEADSSSGLPP